MIGFMESVV